MNLDDVEKLTAAHRAYQAALSYYDQVAGPAWTNAKAAMAEANQAHSKAWADIERGREGLRKLGVNI